MTKRKAVMWADELECQDSPVLAVLKYYGSPLTREEFLSLHFMGEIPELIDSEEGRGGFPGAVSSSDPPRHAARVGESAVRCD
jgi:hypothetical protein